MKKTIIITIILLISLLSFGLMLFINSENPTTEISDINRDNARRNQVEVNTESSEQTEKLEKIKSEGKDVKGVQKDGNVGTFVNVTSGNGGKK